MYPQLQWPYPHMAPPIIVLWQGTFFMPYPTVGGAVPMPPPSTSYPPPPPNPLSPGSVTGIRNPRPAPHPIMTKEDMPITAVAVIA